MSIESTVSAGNECRMQKTELLEIAFAFLQRSGFLQRLHTVSDRKLLKAPMSITQNFNIVLDYEINLNELFNYNNDLFDKIIDCPREYLYLFQSAVNAEITSKYAYTSASCELVIRTTKPSTYEGNSRYGKNGALSYFNDYVLTALSVKEGHSHILNDCFANSSVEDFPSNSQVEYFIDKTKIRENNLHGDTSLHTEKIRALFLNSKAFKFETGALYTAIKCRIRDPLIKYLELGSQYHIWGYYTFDQPQEAEYEVLGLEKVNLYSIPIGINFIPPKITSIQSSLQKRYPNNPWAFVNYLALQFGYKDWTLRSYLSVRTALLLSLATVGEKTAVPILCIGKQPIQMAKLMNEISKSALKRINYCNSSCGTIEKSGSDIWIRSGKLTLAASGVCLLGDWETMKPTQKREILSAINNKKITLNTGSAKLSRPIPITLTLPLKSTIWTYLFYEGNSKSLQNLMSEFGIPFIAATKASTLDRFHSSSNKEVLNYNCPSAEEIAQFLQYVNSRAVDLTEEVAQFINDYIVMCRRMRGSDFPLLTTDILTALAKGHARMSLRGEVTCDDVLIVIYFYEEAWQYIYENDKISCSRESPYIYEQIEIFCEEIITFKERLNGLLRLCNH